MRRKAASCSVVFFLAGAALSLAADLQLGTWKLNEAKSKLPPGVTKNVRIVYEAVVDKVRVTIDGVDKDGNPTHNEWGDKYDGIFYPVTGDSASDLRAYKRINAHTLSFQVKQHETVTITGKIVVAKDGKSRTVTAKGVDPTGKKFSSTAVYDRE